ncbi:MAG: 1-acyl-sn-glycerol-3-phosphate acyltransferase [Eubacterium sp.]|nr:1-acyl-sn-glycerol-3-phosphate acyltransferase [Eubacterium sp.]
MKEFDYSTVPHYKFYRFAVKVFGPAFRKLYHITYKGLENVPKDKHYIVGINHTCALDPVFVALGDNMPALHFIAKAELFKNPVVAWVITHLYGFPVKRGQGDRTAIEYAEKIIKENHVLAVCPEGKRIKDKNGVPQQAKAGIAMFAHHTGASVLPVAICCKNKIKRGEKLTVVYGKPLTLSDLGLDKDEVSKDEYKAAANKVMETIADMREKELNGN